MSFNHKKKFGQNFLTSSGMQQKIINEFEAHFVRNKKLIEIGPGVGDLTQLITAHNPLLLEIDMDAVEVLQDRFPQLEVRCRDALEMVESKDSVFENSYLFSNLPYNVGSRILMAMGKNFPTTPFTVILQAEVAYKTLPHKANLTFFGAWINYVWDTRVPLKISKGNFTPAPRVDSAMLQGTPRFNDGQGLERKFSLLKNLFVQPNKTVRNNLKKMGWENKAIDELYEQYNFPDTLRLTWDNVAEVLDSVYEFEQD